MGGPVSPHNPQVAPPPVPRTNRDPVSSLRPSPIVITVGGQEIEIPALPAVDWLEVLMSENFGFDDLFIELLPDGVSMMLDDWVTPEDMEDLGLAILEEASARHWWIATRLIGTLMEHWDVMGPEATFHNVDPNRLSLAAWLDSMLVLLMQRIQADQQPMFVARLEQPPAGEELPVEDFEMSAEQFMSMGAD